MLVLRMFLREEFIHERLGHLSWKVIAEMLDENNPLCIRAGITAREVKEIGEKYTCCQSANLSP